MNRPTVTPNFYVLLEAARTFARSYEDQPHNMNTPVFCGLRSFFREYPDATLDETIMVLCLYFGVKLPEFKIWWKDSVAHENGRYTFMGGMIPGETKLGIFLDQLTQRFISESKS